MKAPRGQSLSAGAHQTWGAGWRRTAKSHFADRGGFNLLCAGRTMRGEGCQGLGQRCGGYVSAFRGQQSGQHGRGNALGK